MRSKMHQNSSPIVVPNVDDLLHGVGLELMLKSEELIYAKRTLTEEECMEVGSDLYLIAEVVGAIITQHRYDLQVFRVTLPEHIGMLRVRNPYFDSASESPSDKSKGRSDGSGDEFPF